MWADARHQRLYDHQPNSFPIDHKGFRSQPVEARKKADRLACEAWNKRMLGFQGPAQPSPALGDALNAGYLYLEVKRLGYVPIRLSRSTSSGGPRQRQSMNWSATCAARTARRCAAIPTSGAILSRCGSPKFRPTNRRQHGRRASDDLTDLSTVPRQVYFAGAVVSG